MIGGFYANSGCFLSSGVFPNSEGFGSVSCVLTANFYGNFENFDFWCSLWALRLNWRDCIEGNYYCLNLGVG